MTLNVTRGGLRPATLKNLNNNRVVKFMFNPFEYTIKKTNTWAQQEGTGTGLNIPIVAFKEGGAITLDLTLHFDTQDSGQDVRGYTAPLWDMMMIDESKKNQRSNKSQPPPVAFEWGRLYFKAIITSMSESFTLFSENGVPLRCQVQVSLQQYIDERDTPPQIQGQGGGQNVPKTSTLVEGERLDHVASQNGGSPSNYRNVAEQNNIDNPQRVPSGTVLRT